MSNGFRITPLPAEVADRVRRTMTDELGNRLSERRDEDRHQCRSCLRLTEPNEPYVGLSYRPFPGPQPFAESGPVYLHLRPCQPYAQAGEWPAEFPRSRWCCAPTARTTRSPTRATWAAGGRGRGRELLADPRNAYVHARNSTYGCFMFRVDRA